MGFFVGGERESGKGCLNRLKRREGGDNKGWRKKEGMQIREKKEEEETSLFERDKDKRRG